MFRRLRRWLFGPSRRRYFVFVADPGMAQRWAENRAIPDERWSWLHTMDGAKFEKGDAVIRLPGWWDLPEGDAISEKVRSLYYQKFVGDYADYVHIQGR